MASPKTTRLLTHLFNSVQHRIESASDDRLGVELDSEPTHFADWSGRPDIWISARGRGNAYAKTGIVVIELEHYSGAEQARTNLSQAVNWARTHPRQRPGSFMS